MATSPTKASKAEDTVLEAAATPEVAAAEAAATPEASADAPRQIRAIYGRMVDPHTGLEFDVRPTELFKMTGWVQSQLDAGKLAFC